MLDTVENSPGKDYSIRPVIPKGTHPVETGKYLLPTNEIVKMHNTVSKWIDNRAPGGIIYGRPRIGKTRSITYLMHDLPAEFNQNIPVFHMRCRHYKLAKENEFFEDLLLAVKHALPYSGKASIKRDRLFRFLLEKAELSFQKRIIIFVDDAQRLFELHYGWLMDLYNELDHAGISMTAILVGQEELIHQRSSFIQGRKAQIVGRFMVHEHEFTGLKGLNDMKACLSGYDQISEYPENSGWSFTRYYFPDLFDDGFRLESCAEELLSVFTNLRKEAGLSQKFDIPMQYLALSVEYALRKYGVEGEDVHSLTQSQWEKAVIHSGYIEAELFQEVV